MCLRRHRHRMLAGRANPKSFRSAPPRSTSSRAGFSIPVGVTAAVCIILFSLTNFYQIMYVFSGYLLFCIFYACYVYSGIQKPIFIYLNSRRDHLLRADSRRSSARSFTYSAPFFPATTPASRELSQHLHQHVFRRGPDGRADEGDPGFDRSDHRDAHGRSTRPMRRRRAIPIGCACRRPLDGLMFGLAAGAGFIFVETLFQYVPNMVNTVREGIRRRFRLCQRLRAAAAARAAGRHRSHGLGRHLRLLHRPGGALSQVDDQTAGDRLGGAGVAACVVELVELSWAAWANGYRARSRWSCSSAAS